MASTYLTRTVGSGGSTTTGTISFWLKRGDTGATQHFYVNKNTSSNASFSFLFSSDTIYINQYDGTSPFNPANYQINLQTPSVFRDYNAWYHIVLIIDTSNGTEANRIRLYVNNVQQTLNKVGNQPTVTQNLNVPFLYNGGVSKIGSDYNGGTNFGGILTHFHFIDGTAYDASTFGETDATTGIWKPKTAPSVTYGTNGFFLKFENSGSMGTDSSGNANNFTVNGTMTQTVDTPSNVFATINSLDNRFNAGAAALVIPTLSNGNLQAVGTSAEAGCICNSTLAINNGKYYAEYKLSNNNQTPRFGIISKYLWDSSSFPTAQTDVAYTYRYDANKEHNGTVTSYGASYTTGDIIGIAFDCTNGNLEFYKNGVSQGVAFTGIPSNQDWCFMFVGLLNDTAQANFGNGYFGTTAVASAESPDDGVGIFEYSVPTGYKALCTKSINAQEYS